MTYYIWAAATHREYAPGEWTPDGAGVFLHAAESEARALHAMASDLSTYEWDDEDGGGFCRLYVTRGGEIVSGPYLQPGLEAGVYAPQIVGVF